MYQLEDTALIPGNIDAYNEVIEASGTIRTVLD